MSFILVALVATLGYGVQRIVSMGRAVTILVTVSLLLGIRKDGKSS